MDGSLHEGGALPEHLCEIACVCTSLCVRLGVSILPGAAVLPTVLTRY